MDASDKRKAYTSWLAEQNVDFGMIRLNVRTRGRDAGRQPTGLAQAMRNRAAVAAGQETPLGYQLELSLCQIRLVLRVLRAGTKAASRSSWTTGCALNPGVTARS